MKKVFILALVLGAFIATEAFGTPGSYQPYGGWNCLYPPDHVFWILYDYFGNPLLPGDCVCVYWKGPNGVRDGLDMSNPPNPLPDDVMIECDVIDANTGAGPAFGFAPLPSYQSGSGDPAQCDEVYLIIFDAPCDQLAPCNYFGYSEQIHVPAGDVLISAQFPGDPGAGHTDIHPVELMSFDAIARDGEVLLVWKTASETENFGFHIERSVDDLDFERITEEAIPGAVNSETENTYTYVDKGLVNGTTYYYNLITVGLDGLELVANASPVSATPTAHGPTVFALHQNYPNPFNPWTDIKYVIPKDVHVTLRVYTVLGAEVATLVDAYQEANSFTVRWDAGELASGLYFCRLKAGDFSKTIKMVLVK